MRRVPKKVKHLCRKKRREEGHGKPYLYPYNKELSAMFGRRGNRYSSVVHQWTPVEYNSISGYMNLEYSRSWDVNKSNQWDEKSKNTNPETQRGEMEVDFTSYNSKQMSNRHESRCCWKRLIYIVPPASKDKETELCCQILRNTTVKDFDRSGDSAWWIRYLPPNRKCMNIWKME